MADQLLSSAINFSLGVAVARTGTPTDFGIYGLVFSAYLISINITRPLGVEPLIIVYMERSLHDWREQLRAASGAVVVAGAILGVMALMIGLAFRMVIGEGSGLAYAVLGIGLVGLVLQDTWRLTFFAERRGSDAFLNDLIWAIVTLTAMAWLAVASQATVVTLVMAWALGGNVAALIGTLRVGAIPRPSQARWWWTAQRALARPLLVEHVVTNVVGEAIPYLVGAIAGIGAVAAMRAAQLLLGPFNILFQALGLIALPEAVRIAARSRTRLIEAASDPFGRIGGCRPDRRLDHGSPARLDRDGDPRARRGTSREKSSCPTRSSSPERWQPPARWSAYGRSVRPSSR